MSDRFLPHAFPNGPEALITAKWIWPSRIRAWTGGETSDSDFIPPLPGRIGQPVRDVRNHLTRHLTGPGVGGRRGPIFFGGHKQMV